MAELEREDHSNSAKSCKFRLRCAACDGNSKCNHDPYYDYLFAEYNYARIDKKRLKKLLAWYERFEQLLPYADASSVKSLGEGATPLVASKQYKNVYFKDEGRNPSGCFKDRESAVLIPYLTELGHYKFALASSGNAALSASLYGRMFGCEVVCAIPRGTSIGKKKLIKVFGGTIVEIGKYYEDCHRALLDSTKFKKYTNITAGIHPLKDQGDKVISFELWDELGVPDFVVVPVANGALLSGMYQGFHELHILGLIKRMPCFIGVQMENADPVKRAMALGKKDFSIVKKIDDSRAEGLAAMESFASPKALHALYTTKGFIITVKEKELIEGMRYAVQDEGLLPEWTSSSVFAAWQKIAAQKLVPSGARVVVVNTGNGLKEIVDIAETIG